jgi:hypothetical protein
MTKTDTIQTTSKDITGLINSAIDLYVENLRRKQIINESQFEETKKYRVIFAERGFFGRIWEAVLGKNQVTLVVTEIIPLPDNNV